MIRLRFFRVYEQSVAGEFESRTLLSLILRSVSMHLLILKNNDWISSKVVAMGLENKH